MTALLLAALVLTADDAPPLMSAKDLLKQCASVDGKVVRVKGSIMSRTRCPPCPPQAQCKPCGGESFTLATLPEAAGAGDRPLRVQVNGSSAESAPIQPAVVEAEGTVRTRGNGGCVVTLQRLRVDGKVVVGPP